MSQDLMQANANLPAHLQGVIGKEVFDEFSGGVSSGFPVISYRGKVWRVKIGGEEQQHTDEDGNALPTIDIVLLKSNPLPSKTFYESGYVEGDQGKPRCWSSDGVRPDSGVNDPISPTCQACPNHVWGSKTTEQGKPTRACQDVRRAAVVMAHELEEVVAGTRDIEDVNTMLLRVPPASLNPLKDYAEGVLKPKGIAPYMLVTRIGFEAEAAFPKFRFKGSRFLSEDEFRVASQLRESAEASRVLNESEHTTVAGEEGSTAGNGEAAPTGQSAAEAKPAAPSKPTKKAKAKPVEEDNAPPRAAEVEATAAKAEVVDDAPTASPPEANPPAGGEDFEAMLDDILG